MLNDLLKSLGALDSEDQKMVTEDALTATSDMVWLPNPGAQTEGYFCEADELFYGGCVSHDTEFLTPNGWKSISGFAEGDLVAQWNSGTIDLTFCEPSEYVDHPCKEFIRFKNSRVSMLLSEDHRMPLYDFEGKFVVKSALDVEAEPSRHKIPTAYKPVREGMDMVDDLVRLGVAIHADGSLAHRKKDGGAHCRISLRKERKKVRLVALLTKLGVPWSEYRNPNRPTEVRYSFDSPILTKHYSGEWWDASQDQLEIILDEMNHWDGCISGDTGGDISFATTSKDDADYIQYVAHGCGRVANIGTQKKIKDNHATLYKVHISTEGSVKSSVVLRGDAITIDRVPTDRMYCFKVPNTFWLARHNGHIFITGNSAGGGKSSLINGLAKNEHHRSLILRQFRDDAKKLAEAELIGMILGGDKSGWNGSDLIYRGGECHIQYGGCDHEDDKQRYKGNPNDLICFDEITDFSETQYRFITIWNRSAIAGQRCRVVSTGNPPTTAAGLWVVRRWAAWLDPTHPNPAKSGELRWYVVGENDEDLEVDGVGPHEFDWSPKPIMARSRTFIPAKLSDNPDLMDDGHYESMLDSLPKDLRDAYRDGQFKVILEDQPKQLIPAAWVKAAQDRWTDSPPEGIPMCAVGVDVAQGGKDESVLAPRYDAWYAPLVKIPGRDTPLGTDLLGPIMAARRDNAKIVLDVGGGYGSDTYKSLMDNSIPVLPHKGAKGSNRKSECGLYGFFNYRAEVHYRFREALNPARAGGSRICLPPDTTLFADLTAILFSIEKSPQGLMVKLEPKTKLCARIGRSPDCGDPVVNAWSSGDKIENSYGIWEKNNSNGRMKQTTAIMSTRRKRRF